MNTFIDLVTIVDLSKFVLSTLLYKINFLFKSKLFENRTIDSINPKHIFCEATVVSSVSAIFNLSFNSFSARFFEYLRKIASTFVLSVYLFFVVYLDDQCEF